VRDATPPPATDDLHLSLFHGLLLSSSRQAGMLQKLQSLINGYVMIDTFTTGSTKNTQCITLLALPA